MKSRKVLILLAILTVLIAAVSLAYLRPRYVVPILVYHRLDGNGEVSSVSVSPKNFQRQMAFLSRHHYNVISLSEFVQAKQASRKLPRNSVIITFDDGYEDNYLFAYPVLKKYNFPAAIFVIVDYIGRPDFLTEAQIKEMAASGIIDIGSHSLTHAYLPTQSAQELKAQIGLSKRLLEERLNKKVDFFCYPLGHFNSQAQNVVRDSGYQAALTTNRGKAQTYLNNDLFALKRIKIKDSANPVVLWAKLSGYYNLFRTVRSPY